MKKIILFFILLFISFTVNASFWTISTDRIFFENTLTKEQKYLEVKTYKNMFIFKYLFFNKYEPIQLWKTQVWNWKAIKMEEFVDNEDWPNKYFYSMSWSIQCASYEIYQDKWEEIKMDNFSDISWIKEFSFWDLDIKWKLKIIFAFIKTFFWLLFIWLLPIHFIVFFPFWRAFFIFYEKFKFKIFKNVIVNTLVFYLLFYIIQIIYWFSFPKLAYWNFMWLMGYPIIFMLLEWIFLFYWIQTIKEFNIEYPDKKINTYNLFLSFFMMILILIVLLYFSWLFNIKLNIFDF